jgi:serine/threonine protein kinase
LKNVWIKILNQIVSGVAAMSDPIFDDEIVIHRDLKVDNILIQISPNGDPIVKIADFGCAIKIKKDKLAVGPVGSIRES